MKPGRFRLLFVFMCLALAGGIALQAYWLMKAVRIERDKFDQDVQSALADAAIKIESGQTSKFISQTLGDHFYDSVFAHRNNKTGRQTDVRIINRIGPEPHHDSATISMIVASDSFPVKGHSFTMEGEPFRHVFSSAVKNVMIKFITSDTLRKINPLQHADVEKALSASLDARGINVPFEYGVWHQNGPSVLVSPGADSVFVKNSRFHVPLPRADFPLPADKLYIAFESPTGYIARMLWPQFLLSFFISAALIAVFFITFREMLRQKKLSDIRNDFINNMTHEFKTPIATISLAADTALNENIISNPEKLRHYLELVKKENKRMNEHVEKVLQAALAERGELRIAPELSSMNEIIRRVADSFRLQVESRQGSLAIESPEEIKASVDPFHFEKALSNLIDNALKYSPEKPSVSISLQRKDKQVILSVSDRGTGISKDEQQRIFDKFYRVSTGNLHDIKGFGLGLNYVRSVMQAHHGDVKLESTPGKGSTFSLVIYES